MRVVFRACKHREIAYNTLRENVIERMLTTGIRSVTVCVVLRFDAQSFSTRPHRNDGGAPKHGGVLLFNLTVNGIFSSQRKINHVKCSEVC